MPSIDYESIYKRALKRIDDLDLASYTEEDFYDTMCEWLHVSISNPLFRKVFSEFTLDDENSKLTFTLSSPVSNDYDAEFITSVLAKGIIINYMPSKIDTDRNLALIIGTDKEKKISGNYSQNMERLKELERDYSRDIARHGYYFGDYGTNNG